MTQLRQIMLDELERRNYAQSTVRNCIRTVEHYSQHFHRASDQLGLEHIRGYQAAMFRTRKLARNTIAQRLAALRLACDPSQILLAVKNWCIAQATSSTLVSKAK